MDELQRLRRELAELRRQNEILADQVRSLDERLAVIAGDTAASTDEPSASRRTLLRVAGAGAIGLVAGAAGAASSVAPVAASTGDEMRVGYSHTTEHQTRIAVGASSPGVGSRLSDGAAVLLVDANGSNGYAIDARGGFHAVRARGSTIGVASYGEKYAFAALSSDTAAVAFGETASSGGGKIAPLDRVDLHARAELDNDGSGNLWWSVSGGTPGQWRKLAGPGSAGAFHPLTPTRVYDSRLAIPSPGRLRSNESRQVRIADGRDLTSGAVDASDLVPVGATAITGNLTAVGTENSGYLTLNEGGNAAVGASALNWHAPGLILSNSFVVKILDRTVTVVAGGGSTHVVIDVTGYYL